MSDDRARSHCPCHNDDRYCDPWEQAIDAAANQAETDRLYREAGL